MQGQGGKEVAEAIFAAINPGRPVKASAGRELLETITSGMYSNPLMSIREYIQNASDAVDKAVAAGLLAPGDERICVSVSGRNRTITVEDNGCGIPLRRVERLLCSLGCSEKRSFIHRGFRGIGRLGGLAYCKRLVFATRASHTEAVTEIEWNGSQLSKVVDDTDDSADLTSAVAELARIRTRKAATNEPAHFFRVTMEGVSRFYDDSLLNMEALRRYLGLVAPVPYDKIKFTFSDQVQDHLAGVPGWRSYRVYLNGCQVLKPYKDEVRFGETNSDYITGVELFEINDVDGSLVGRGWYALTGLLGAIPRIEPARGIHVRQGNIEVGDEHFLKQVFAEHRFAVWHVGEIELVRTVRPNARRDGFEQTPGHERLLAYMSLLGRKLSFQCRAASQRRNQKRRLVCILDKVEQLISDFPIYIDHDHAVSVVNKASMLLSKVRTAALDGMKDMEIGKRYDGLSRMLHIVQKRPLLIPDCIDGRLLGKGCTKSFLEDICRRVIDTCGTDEIAMTVLSRILTPYLKGDFGGLRRGRKNDDVHRAITCGPPQLSYQMKPAR